MICSISFGTNQIPWYILVSYRMIIRMIHTLHMIIIYMLHIKYISYVENEVNLDIIGTRTKSGLPSSCAKNIIPIQALAIINILATISHFL